MMPAQRTRCAQGVRMVRVRCAGSVCLPAQLGQLQRQAGGLASRTDECLRAAASKVWRMQRRDVRLLLSTSGSIRRWLAHGRGMQAQRKGGALRLQVGEQHAGCSLHSVAESDDVSCN